MFCFWLEEWPLVCHVARFGDFFRDVWIRIQRAASVTLPSSLDWDNDSKHWMYFRRADDLLSMPGKSHLLSHSNCTQLRRCGQRKTTATLQRHYTENSKQIFPEMKQRGLVPNSYIHVSVSDWYIPRSVCLFCCRKISGPIVGVNKSLIDTWVWKLGLRPRKFFSGHTYIGFSLQCSVPVLISRRRNTGENIIRTVNGNCNEHAVQPVLPGPAEAAQLPVTVNSQCSRARSAL